MILTRPMVDEDRVSVRAIYDKYYASDYAYEDFMRNYLSNFVITDRDHKIILAGGVKPAAECIIVTDKEHPSEIEVGRALVEAQKIAAYTCQKLQVPELLAFVKDQSYMRHLIRHGFEKRSQALRLRIPNG